MNAELEKVVQDCADHRNAPPPPHTIANAIEDAQWLRRTPDGLLSPERQRQVVEGLLSALEASPCYFKGARLGIPTFTLLAYDKAGHSAIDLWCQLAESHGCRPEKVNQMRAVLTQWALRPDLKWPD